MLFVQISDLHYLRRGVLSFGEVDTHACLERCVAQIKSMRPQPDAVLITGDLTNDGDLEAYQALADLLAELDLPLYPIPGNHDDRELIRKAFPSIASLSPDGPLCYVIEDYPVRILALDSSVDNDARGYLGALQLDWLDTKLAEKTNQPTMVMLHHPPFKTGIGHMDYSMLGDAEDLASLIREHHHVERVLCGHVHRAVQTRFAGTLAQIPPGIAHQVKLVLGHERGPWNSEPPGYLLHYWQAEAGLITHQVPIGNYEPEGRFDQPHTGLST